ncbi:hypothetical protein R80B4_00873 [Fibrobacteres bacterium R8-0-B4]
MTADEFDIKEWMRIAEQDYDSAQKLSGFHPAPIEVICYLSQQSIEKILKAYIIANENKLTKTHDLKILITKCEQYSPDFGNFNAICASLYPDPLDRRKRRVSFSIDPISEQLIFLHPPQ